MIHKRLCMLLTWVTCFFILSATPLQAKEVLYAAAGVKLPLIELAESYEKKTGVKVSMNFDTAGAAEKKFLEDSNATLLITTLERIQQNVAPHQQGEFIPLADTVAGIAISTPEKPKLINTDDLKKTLLQAKSLAFSDPARGATVGKHFLKVIKSLDIEKEVMSKATLARDGVETMKLVQSKKVELGVTQISEIMQADGSLLLGAFPDPYDLSTRYALWFKSGSETLKFSQFLRTKEAHEIYQKHGLRPYK